MVADKYKGEGYVRIVKDKLGYVPGWSWNSEDYLDMIRLDILHCDDNSRYIQTFHRVNFEAYKIIVSMCKDLNQGKEIDLEHILDE